MGSTRRVTSTRCRPKIRADDACPGPSRRASSAIHVELLPDVCAGQECVASGGCKGQESRFSDPASNGLLRQRSQEQEFKLMREALISAGVLIVATLIGALLRPNADQLRPLTPQASSGNADDAGHGHHH